MLIEDGGRGGQRRLWELHNRYVLSFSCSYCFPFGRRGDVRGFSAVVELLLLSCCLSLFAFREDSSGKDEKDAASDMGSPSYTQTIHIRIPCYFPFQTPR